MLILAEGLLPVGGDDVLVALTGARASQGGLIRISDKPCDNDAFSVRLEVVVALFVV